MNDKSYYRIRNYIFSLIITFIISCMPISAFADSMVQTTSPSTILTQANNKKSFSIKEVPAYKDSPSVKVNNNKPFFTDKEKKNTKSFE